MSIAEIASGRTGPLDIEAIKAIIPQRFPFLMLDRVLEVIAGERVIAIKNLTGNEWFYQGHFPTRAVTPGAMLLEAIAQAGIVFFHFCGGRSRKADVTYLLGGAKIRYLEPVYPGSQLIIEITPRRIVDASGILYGLVRVEDRIVAKGEIYLGARRAGKW